MNKETPNKCPQCKGQTGFAKSFGNSVTTGFIMPFKSLALLAVFLIITGILSLFGIPSFVSFILIFAFFCIWIYINKKNKRDNKKNKEDIKIPPEGGTPKASRIISSNLKK